jgi:vacuolar iron transporter family protein
MLQDKLIISPIVEKFQRIEITEHHIYKRLAKKIKDPENSKILSQIADDELRHYHEWKKLTGQEF